MSTLSRKDEPDAVWHITSKVNWAAWHLAGTDAAWTFFACLRGALLRFGVDLIAFVLMSNHFHLVARSPGEELFRKLTTRQTRCRHRRRWPRGHSKTTVIGQCMREAKLAVARLLQSKLGVEGHFWDGRHHRRRVRDEWDLVIAVAYDHRNPVRQGMVAQPEDYDRSSAAWWTRGAAALLPLCTRDDFPFGIDRADFRDRLLRFQQEKRLDDVMEVFGKSGLSMDTRKGRALLEELMMRAGLNP